MPRRNKRTQNSLPELLVTRSRRPNKKQRRDNLRLERIMHDIFAEAGYERDSLSTITDEVISHMDFWQHLGTTPRQALQFMAREYIRKWMRDYRDEKGRRVYQHTGSAWIHLPGRNWLATRQADGPDSHLTRREHKQAVANIAHAYAQRERGNRAGKIAAKSTIKAIDEGAVFEQPRLLETEQSA